MKKRAIERLKGWSENAILCAEVEMNPNVGFLKTLIAEAKAAGLTLAEISALVWYPYENEVK